MSAKLKHSYNSTLQTIAEKREPSLKKMLEKFIYSYLAIFRARVSPQGQITYSRFNEEAIAHVAA